TIGADLDEYEDEDDEDDLTMGTIGGQTMATVQGTTSPRMQATTAKATATSQTIPSPAVQGQMNKDKEKYGQPGLNGSRPHGWEPWQATPQQRFWQQRGLTLIAAFMLASLMYTVLSQLSPLPPSPIFVAVLVGMAPAATLGALLVNWKRSLPWQETINYAISGTSCVFLALGMVRVCWQLALHNDVGPLQLLVMLLVAA